MCSFRSCQTRFEFLSQFRKVRNAFAKNQMRLAYEDKRDLYCITCCNMYAKYTFQMVRHMPGPENR